MLITKNTILQTLLFGLIVLFGVSFCQLGSIGGGLAGSSEPYLIVVKEILTEEPAASRDLIINVKIFNVGTSSAYDLRLEGNKEGFESVTGLTQAKWDRLAAGANISHTYVVKPSKAGPADSSSVEVYYRDAPKGAEEIVYSTNIPQYYFSTSREAARRSELRLKEWGIFILLAAFSLAPAFFNWFSIQRSYEGGIKKQN